MVFGEDGRQRKGIEEGSKTQSLESEVSELKEFLLISHVARLSFTSQWLKFSVKAW